jgi:transcriptional regulator with XRE-family HTH domain
MSHLKEVRILKKISQFELAQRLKMTQASVCQMERKGIYDTRIANKYAKALNCSPIFLLEGLDKHETLIK